MNILITGANGFLGSYLVKHFVKLNYFVFALVRKDSNLARLASVRNVKNLNVLYIENGLYDISSRYEIDIVIHAATSYGRNNESAYDVFKANELFSLELLQLSISSKVKLFINSDSFFNKDEFENYPYLEYYQVSKKNFLSWGKILASQGLVKFINIRLEQVYGAGDSESKFVEFVISSLKNNVPDLNLTFGEQKRDFIYISDVVNAYAAIIESLNSTTDSFAEFELGTGISTTVKDFVLLTKQITKSTTKLNFGSISYRKNEIMESKADIMGLLHLGWTPRITLAEGIVNILEKYKQLNC